MLERPLACVSTCFWWTPNFATSLLNEPFHNHTAHFTKIYIYIIWKSQILMTFCLYIYWRKIRNEGWINWKVKRPCRNDRRTTNESHLKWICIKQSAHIYCSNNNHNWKAQSAKSWTWRMERDDKVNRVTECNCSFPILWFLYYLSLYKNTFNGSLDFIVPTKRSLYSKRAPQKTYGPFLPCSTSFHAPPSELQSTEKSDSSSELQCENTDSYFEKTPGAEGERRGRFLRVIYVEPDD